MYDQRKKAVLRSGVFERVIGNLFPGVQKARKGQQILLLCPFHDDSNPSLSIHTKTGKFHCFGCGVSGNGFDLYMRLRGCDFITALHDLESLVGIKKTSVSPRRRRSEVVAVYEYHDENGYILYRKKRYEPGFNGRKKSFAFYHEGPHGVEQKGRGGAPVPYNCHLLASANKGEPIFFTEGEAKADALTKWQLCATSLDTGSQSGKGASWNPNWNHYFTGREIYLLPDNDEPGELYAGTIGKHILPIAKSVKILRLPNLPPKGDIIDWLRQELANV